jgi:hypothetical protein
LEDSLQGNLLSILPKDRLLAKSRMTKYGDKLPVGEPGGVGIGILTQLPRPLETKAIEIEVDLPTVRCCFPKRGFKVEADVVVDGQPIAPPTAIV